jgi:hypothetical protein
MSTTTEAAGAQPNCPSSYPIDALGPGLQPAAEALHYISQAPLALCAQSLLGSVSLAGQSLANIDIGGCHRPVSCYFVSIAESGERKSTVDGHAMQSIRDFEVGLRDGLDGKPRPANNGQASVSCNSANKVLVNGQGSGGVSLPCLTVEEPSVDGLIRVIEYGFPSLGLYSDEGGRLIGGQAMNSSNLLRMASILSDLWGGKPIEKVRANKPPQRFYGRRFSVHLQMQPVVAEGFINSPLLLAQGLGSRLLICEPVSTKGTRLLEGREARPEATTTMAAFHKRIATILEKDLPLREGTPQELNPPALLLTPAAAACWVSWHDSMESGLGALGEWHHAEPWASKAGEHAQRLAALLTLFDDPEAREIDVDHMERGVALAKFYRDEFVRLIAHKVIDPLVQDAQLLLAWIREHWHGGKITLSLCQNRLPNRLRRRKEAEPAFLKLVEWGHLESLDGEHEIDGAMRQKAYSIVRHSPVLVRSA